MRKEEYIQEVISKIENKKARREVEKELSAHIDDRILYYTDAGYEEEISNTKALEHMGEPGKVGIQMAKLHKRNVLKVIAVSLLIAIVLTAVVFTFTTPMITQINMYKYDKTYCMPTEDDEEPVYSKDVDWFYVARKSGKLMNLVYKINPSIRNLDACHGTYSVSNLKYGLYYNNEVPKDYKKNCVKYAELMYNSEYRDKWSNGLFGIVAVPVVDDPALHWKLGWGTDYALALYLNGQVEESEKVIEECISLIGDKEENATLYWTMKDYFYYVYTATEDEALKAWVLEKENEINEICKGMEKYQKYFSKHDSIYTNPPSLKEYIEGEWVEYEPDYDDIVESIAGQLRIFDDYDNPDMRENIGTITGTTYMGESDSEGVVLKYQYSNNLTFEVYDIPFSKMVFYVDGEEFKTVELR